MSTSVSHQTWKDVPEPVARVADLMSAFQGAWFLCGGWAVDAWLGRQTRDHHDVDIAVFEDDLAAMREHFAGLQLIAHDSVEPDSTESWVGRRLYLPAHIHARRQDEYELDVQVNERSGTDWVLSREPSIGIDLARGAGKCDWGLPILAPEVILFYKAREARPQDEADFRLLGPHLTELQVSWLREAIARVQPGHPWLAELSV